MMARIKDFIVYPHKPDSRIGSENDGDSDEVGFAIAGDVPKDESRMPTIKDAYKKRYKEYR